MLLNSYYDWSDQYDVPVSYDIISESLEQASQLNLKNTFVTEEAISRISEFSQVDDSEVGEKTEALIQEHGTEIFYILAREMSDLDSVYSSVLLDYQLIEQGDEGTPSIRKFAPVVIKGGCGVALIGIGVQTANPVAVISGVIVIVDIIEKMDNMREESKLDRHLPQ